MTPDKFFSSSVGLSLTIYDYDAFGPDDILGVVFVTQEELLEGTGERVEYPVIMDRKYEKATRGCRLALRFRLARPRDVEFMKTFEAHRKHRKVGAFASEAFVPVRYEKGSKLGPLRRETRKNKDTKEREVRSRRFLFICEQR